MADRTEQEALELEQLQKNSPYALPDNAAASGWTTAQIKEKFYAGLFYLYNLFKQLRVSNDEFTEEVSGEITEIQGVVADTLLAVNNLTSLLGTYAKIADISNGTIAALKYVKANGTTENIRKIAEDLDVFITQISAYFNGNKAKKAEEADKATLDGNGRNIVNTYATQVALQSLSTTVNNLLNGSVSANKAINDDEGNAIKNTYVKKSQIVNNLTSTSTTAPLSAAQGKALKDALDTLSNYIYNGAANTSIDRLAEVFAFLTGHDDDETLDGILAGKISFTDIVDNLTTENSGKPLSAKQGKVLEDHILLRVLISDIIDNLTSDATNKPLSAKQGKALKALIDALSSDKADASAVYTKEGAEDMVDAKIAALESVNVIADEDENKNYTYQIKIQSGKAVIYATEVE